MPRYCICAYIMRSEVIKNLAKFFSPLVINMQQSQVHYVSWFFYNSSVSTLCMARYCIFAYIRRSEVTQKFGKKFWSCCGQYATISGPLDGIVFLQLGMQIIMRCRGQRSSKFWQNILGPNISLCCKFRSPSPSG